MRISVTVLLSLMALANLAGGVQAQSSFGNPSRGAALIGQIGCGSCHIIPGIPGAKGLVGPPLDHMSRRIFLAGLLRNTPKNMVDWLMHPQSFVPGNAMPDTGLNAGDAHDITAYLGTLR